MNTQSLSKVPSLSMYLSKLPTKKTLLLLGGATIVMIACAALVGASSSGLFFSLHSFPSWFQNVIHIVGSKWLKVILTVSVVGTFLAGQLSIVVIKTLKEKKDIKSQYKKISSTLNLEAAPFFREGTFKKLPKILYTEETNYRNLYLSEVNRESDVDLSQIPENSKKVLSKIINQSLEEFDNILLKHMYSKEYLSFGTYCNYSINENGFFRVYLNNSAEEINLTPTVLTGLLYSAFSMRYKEDFDVGDLLKGIGSSFTIKPKPQNSSIA